MSFGARFLRSEFASAFGDVEGHAKASAFLPREWSASDELDYDLRFNDSALELCGDGFVAVLSRDGQLRLDVTSDASGRFARANLQRARWAYDALARGGLMLHSSAVVDEHGRAIVLVGPSGVGKSTLAFGHSDALGDDINLVVPVEGSLVAIDPSDGRSAPVRAIGALDQSEGASVARRMSELHAAVRLAAASPFVSADPHACERALDHAFALAARAPRVHLFAALDDEPVRVVIDLLERSGE